MPPSLVEHGLAESLHPEPGAYRGQCVRSQTVSRSWLICDEFITKQIAWRAILNFHSSAVERSTGRLPAEPGPAPGKRSPVFAGRVTMPVRCGALRHACPRSFSAPPDPPRNSHHHRPRGQPPPIWQRRAAAHHGPPDRPAHRRCASWSIRNSRPARPSWMAASSSKRATFTASSTSSCSNTRWTQAVGPLAPLTHRRRKLGRRIAQFNPKRVARQNVAHHYDLSRRAVRPVPRRGPAIFLRLLSRSSTPRSRRRRPPRSATSPPSCCSGRASACSTSARAGAASALYIARRDRRRRHRHHAFARSSSGSSNERARRAGLAEQRALRAASTTATRPDL